MGAYSSEISDVVQETFLLAARRFDQFDAQRGTVRGWLIGIARNQVALEFRRRSQNDRLKLAWVKSLALQGDGAEGHAGQGQSPLDAHESQETAQNVQLALGQLPTDQAELLIARYLDGEDSGSLALRLNCTDQALRARLSRARSAFRAIFSRQFETSAEITQ